MKIFAVFPSMSFIHNLSMFGHIKKKNFIIEEIMEYLMTNLFFVAILMANFLFVLFILCIERKNPAMALSWILALIFLPVLGFVLYLLFGTNVMIRKKKTLENKRQHDHAYALEILTQIEVQANGKAAEEKLITDSVEQGLIQLNLNLGNSIYTTNNDLDIFVTAKDKYRQLIRDIESAKTSIHMLYFIIRNDRIGRMIIEVLARKARSGVSVRLLYDHAGCLLTPAKTFKPLLDSGAKVERFFPIGVGNYLRINFRNHRKIVIIDSLIGYLGGMNIGDEYMGLTAANTLWRDTHLCITGSSVYLLQLRFLEDWRFATNYQLDETMPDIHALFPPVKETGHTRLQLVSSGPDTNEEEIKWNFLKLIYAAKKHIYIQTPYFVPDDSFLEALKIAVMSGVKVTIMVPSKTDNMIVHKVSLSYLGELLAYGIKVYQYPGFLHAKMMLIDDSIASIGSANMDMRSFSLNFEINAFMYGEEITKRCLDIFQKDLDMATKIDLEDYQNRSIYVRMQEGIYRLIAPLM